MRFTAALYFFILSNFISAQTSPFEQTANESFSNFMSGVKFAELLTSKDQEALIFANPGPAGVYNQILNHLKRHGFEEVGYSAKFRNTIFPSFCDLTRIHVNMKFSGKYLSKYELTFFTCEGKYYRFRIRQPIRVRNYSMEGAVEEAMKEILGPYKKSYNAVNKIKLVSRKTYFTEESMKEKWKRTGMKPMEGIYKKLSGDGPKYEVAMFYESGDPALIYLDGANNYLDWSEGDVKAELNPTSSSIRFVADWYMANKSSKSGFDVSFYEDVMLITDPDGGKNEYVKLFPSATDVEYLEKGATNTGTAFLISHEGHLVTNAHVVQNAKKIEVSGGWLGSESVLADVVLIDNRNDLALLKITNVPSDIPSIKYIIAQNTNDVGTDIFTLGYPLINSMGTELKLTDGVISSKTGYEGDISLYQISAPVQPGNSGGPLFNSLGEVIGVVNAKHGGAENASYAIKSSYLYSLIYSNDEKIELKRINGLANSSLPEKVKAVGDQIVLVKAKLTQ